MLSFHLSVFDFAEAVSKLTAPDKVIWIDGSELQLEELRKQACHTGELIALNGDKLPGCYLHRSDPRDVARIEERTFLCLRQEEEAGPTNHWADPEAMYDKLCDIARHSMKGRTMYVIPYSMGVPGSPFAQYGVEVTDSIYVVLSMAIMTRISPAILEKIQEGASYIMGIHCTANLDPEQRYIAHFPEDNLIFSVNSGYGGNALLGKKCFALRMASSLGRREGWLAEHMLILGVQNPMGQVQYMAAAFPSACGKTNLAMLIPPEGYQQEGWKVWCLGDDIAWIRPGPDGRLWAVNPENGFFGVAPGTGAKSNPNALSTMQRNTIFTNVVRDLSDNTVWWEGLNKTPPTHAEDWLGRPWNGETALEKGAHPNSRFTAPAQNCPCISPQFNAHNGVPLSAILFGGRRARTAPLVYQARSWEHGVFIGASMASETTAAAAGKVGVTRRDPMAMLPFCGYHMADYWSHWLRVGNGVTHPPQVFHVNWFRTDEGGRFLWPGFGDNLRVLQWVLDRCNQTVPGIASPIGTLPGIEELNLDGCPVHPEDLKDILTVDTKLWQQETKDIRAYFSTFGPRVPAALWNQLDCLEQALK